MKYLLILTILIFVSQAVAEDSAVDKAERISSTVMSPYCPGRTLAACPSDSARQLRGQIESWFEQGYSETAVHNQLQMLYGTEVFGVPQKRGFGLVGWYAPAAFLIVGLILVFLFLKRGMKFLGETGSRVSAAVAPDKRAKIEHELARRMKEG